MSLQWSGETLACCWGNGRVDWRSGNTGKVLRRVQMRSAAAAMLLADYRSVGVPDLVCVSDKGEGWFYLLLVNLLSAITVINSYLSNVLLCLLKGILDVFFFPLSIVLGYIPYQEAAGFNAAQKMSSEEDRAAITELFNKKQALMVELQHYEANVNLASGSASLEERSSTAMPTNTRLQVAVTPSTDEVSYSKLTFTISYSLSFLYSVSLCTLM